MYIIEYKTRPVFPSNFRMEFSILVHCVFQAYDHHLNMILGDCEETVTTIEIDEETYEEVKFLDFFKLLI